MGHEVSGADFLMCFFFGLFPVSGPHQIVLLSSSLSVLLSPSCPFVLASLFWSSYISVCPNHFSVAPLIYSLMFALISSVLIFLIFFIPIFHFSNLLFRLNLVQPFSVPRSPIHQNWYNVDHHVSLFVL